MVNTILLLAHLSDLYYAFFINSKISLIMGGNMIITFCGHSIFKETVELKLRVLDLIKKQACGKFVEFYLGGYGQFDSFAKQCCSAYKASYPNCKLTLVLPYNTDSFLKSHAEQISGYDDSFYPELELVPKKFAISHRNRYMVQKADFVIAYVFGSAGGCATTLAYAISKNKNYTNLA